jgi:ABC-type polysaccharide/polyol phosphate export permease
MDPLKSLFRYRELLYLFTWRDIRIRYKQSLMGFLWALLMPLLIIGAGALVRVAAAKWSGTSVTPQDMASVMVRAVAWSFFVSAIRFGANSLTTNANLVTKIAFPKEVFPISAVLSSLFDFGVAIAAVALVLPVIGILPTLQWLWLFPLLVVMVLQAVGITLILSAANLFYRDVKYLVEVFLTYAIFFTPVLYPASVVGSWKTLIMINPISPLLEALSDSLVTNVAPSAFWTLYSTLVSLILVLGGYWLFKQFESKFAESI